MILNNQCLGRLCWRGKVLRWHGCLRFGRHLSPSIVIGNEFALIIFMHLGISSRPRPRGQKCSNVTKKMSDTVSIAFSSLGAVRLPNDTLTVLVRGWHFLALRDEFNAHIFVVYFLCCWRPSALRNKLKLPNFPSLTNNVLGSAFCPSLQLNRLFIASLQEWMLSRAYTRSENSAVLAAAHWRAQQFKSSKINVGYIK